MPPNLREGQSSIGPVARQIFHRMKRIVSPAATALLIALSCATSAWACPYCRVEVRDRTFGSDFASTAFLLLLPLLVIGAIGAFLYFSDRPSGKRHADQSHD